ncbi:MAG: carbamoyltransferase HypF [Proteobacteria bacterium]|nr:carbamoyltransferase HypF [Pseudomonadota bacterium]
MRRRIEITGVVQGVGFRPFVYNLARSFGLTGWCLNSGAGVTIEVEGAEVGAFITALRASPPPRANIEHISVAVIAPHANIAEGFEIKESSPSDLGHETTHISPDIATCAECAKELLDPTNRRHLYPFINCTNCGPRYSITIGVPYDRPLTTMAPFTMCAACQSEYDDPADRRFHAQPNGCAECGPRAWVEATKVEYTTGGDDRATNYKAIETVQQALKDGAIAALKGLGGFHLACDAANSKTVERLRRLKRTGRSKEQNNKPFALMVKSIERAREFAVVGTDEARLLASATAPILLVDKRAEAKLPDSIARGSTTYGIMLPYTPLHHLLFHGQGSSFDALVMTSGNRSDEPIAIDNDEAKERLSGIADLFLFHDRSIHLRVDDSIMRINDGRPTVLRRARGITPTAIKLKSTLPDSVAFGAQQKNSICIGHGTSAIPGPHIGELDTESAIGFQASTIKSLLEINNIEPEIVAHDLHPDYASTHGAVEFAKSNSISKDRVFAIQHHHAHIVSCMAEHGLTGPVVGVAFDGTGAGTDGNVWGGEFFISKRDSYIRRAHFKYIAMAGAERAVEEPWRMALGYILQAYGEEGNPERPGEVVGRVLARIPDRERINVLKMIDRKINSPLTSSAGRLFDAVSSILGLRDRATYEGEAAVELEAMAYTKATDTLDTKKTYGYTVSDTEPYVIDVAPMIRAIIEEHEAGIDRAEISKRFHHSIAAIITDTALRLSKEAEVTDVVLSGGVFQNRLLCRLAKERLTRAGLTPWFNSTVPTNDGGISLGQIVAAAEQFSKQRKESGN